MPVSRAMRPGSLSSPPLRAGGVVDSPGTRRRRWVPPRHRRRFACAEGEHRRRVGAVAVPAACGSAWDACRPARGGAVSAGAAQRHRWARSRGGLPGRGRVHRGGLRPEPGRTRGGVRPSSSTCRSDPSWSGLAVLLDRRGAQRWSPGTIRGPASGVRTSPPSWSPGVGWGSAEVCVVGVRGRRLRHEARRRHALGARGASDLGWTNG